MSKYNKILLSTVVAALLGLTCVASPPMAMATTEAKAGAAASTGTPTGAAPAGTSEGSGELWISVKGIKNDSGYMAYTLCSGEGCLSGDAEPLKDARLTVRRMHHEEEPYRGPAFGSSFSVSKETVKKDEKDHKAAGHHDDHHSMKAKFMSIWIIRDLPFGEYSVSVFHDMDGNGIRGEGTDGGSAEPYGVSTSACGHRPADSQIEAPRGGPFSFNREEQKVVIEIR